MNINIFREKADSYKKELKHTKVIPQKYVDFYEDPASFQGLRVIDIGSVSFPIELKFEEPIILDFGKHCVGYLHYTTKGEDPIVDSPLGIDFAFGEFPLEIVREPSEYKGGSEKDGCKEKIKSPYFSPPRSPWSADTHFAMSNSPA